ncbi:hypothetical protein DFP93_101286 [Aneurinibacillus soli]|uniref:Uncharacterized protein n=1 Tax=Aneurinibacillus soli TaxID=1500254 RepID=A0A0U5AWU6_9BACL|nr:hypothetical protein [Aneurinibacillus soli]PYE64260.1 hypothetical protein DFP93_101286 [Aneurinibacillus soli]BAU28209.1 hypothetical protein CB4_02383 [Aneurinibacillus soli]
MCKCNSRVNVIINECCDCGSPGTGSDPSHNHDDRYYTKGETDTLLAEKAPLHHTHTASEIQDFVPAVEQIVNTLPQKGANVQVNGVPVIPPTVNFKNGDGIVLNVEERGNVADITVSSDIETTQLTKLGQRAGDTFIHPITKPSALLDYSPIEVLKFALTQQGAQLYAMGFNNTDADQFNFDPLYTQFTGVMKPVNQKDYLMEKTTWSESGVLFQVDIDSNVAKLESVLSA